MTDRVIVSNIRNSIRQTFGTASFAALLLFILQSAVPISVFELKLLANSKAAVSYIFSPPSGYELEM